MGFKGNALVGVLHRDVSRGGSMVMSWGGGGVSYIRLCPEGVQWVMYRVVCPEGVQNKCPGGVWCRGFMSWGGYDISHQ